MLLREVKLLEIDDTPFERALGKAAGALTSSGRYGHTADRAPKEDVNVNLRPLIELIASRLGEGSESAIYQSEVKKLTSTPELAGKAHAAIENLQSIVKNILLLDFSNGIKDLNRIKEIAIAAGQKDVSTWLDTLLEQAEHEPLKLLTQKNRQSVIDAFRENKEGVIQALMKVNNAKRFAEGRVQLLKERAGKKFKPEVQPKHDEALATLIEVYHAYFAAVLMNINAALQLIDAKTKS